MEAAGHTVAETTGVGETHTMTDITHAMAEAAAYVVAAGNAHTHAVAETATAEMGDTYDAVVETHAVMDDAPISADACVSETVAVPAIKYGGVAVIAVIPVIPA